MQNLLLVGVLTLMGEVPGLPLSLHGDAGAPRFCKPKNSLIFSSLFIAADNIYLKLYSLEDGPWLINGVWNASLLILRRVLLLWQC